MKFEYKKVSATDVMDGDAINVKKLNKYGAEGWELCYVTNWNGKAAFFYFKREIKD